jgi:hypothetical protein
MIQAKKNFVRYVTLSNTYGKQRLRPANPVGLKKTIP